MPSDPLIKKYYKTHPPLNQKIMGVNELAKISISNPLGSSAKSAFLKIAYSSSL
jgi:hypothetical protein